MADKQRAVLLRFLGCVAVGVLFGTASGVAAAGPAGVTDSAGLERLGWVRQGDWQMVPPAKLHAHINGAADLFLSKGVQSLSRAAFAFKQRTGAAMITVDIYDMGAAARADAVFCAKGGGAGASMQSYPGACIFYVKRWYVEMQSAGSAPISPELLRESVSAVRAHLAAVQ